MSAPALTIQGRVVRLTADDVRACYMGGCERNLDAVINRRAGGGRATYGGWEDNIRGASGELAVCRALGLTWDPTIGRVNAPDAGPYQVRTTHYDDGHLILRKEEVRTDQIFILVTGFVFEFTIRGGLIARHGERAIWWRKYDLKTGKYRPAYFVPQDALLPLEDLGIAPVDRSRVPEVGKFPTLTRG